MTFAEIQTAINLAFRDHVTFGLPASGDHEPVKSEVRAALANLVIALDDGGFSEPPDWAADLAEVVSQLETVEATQADLEAFQATLTAEVAAATASATAAGGSQTAAATSAASAADSAGAATNAANDAEDAATAAEAAAAVAAASEGAVASSASAAAGSQSEASASAQTAAILAGLSAVYATKAAATAALGSIAANAYVLVQADESQSGKRIIYQKQSGSLVSVIDLSTLTTSSGLTFSNPLTNDRFITVPAIDADNSPFYFNRSTTANPGNAGRPNEVVNYGHNLNSGAGPVTAGKGLFGMGFEGHYEPNPGEAYFEWHIYAGFEDDGLQRRPDSMRLDKNSNLNFGWGRLMRHNLLTYTEPKKNTPYMQAQPAGFTWLGFNNEDTGEPEGGFSLVCDGSGGAGSPVIFSRVGATARALSLTTWNDIILPFGWTLQSPGQLFMTADNGQGVIGLTDTDTDAFLVIRHQRDIKIGRYGGNDLVWVDNTNDRIAIGAATEAPRYKTHIMGDLGLTPSASITPSANGDLVVEATNDTTLTFKLKGSDGTVRTGTISLS